MYDHNANAAEYSPDKGGVWKPKANKLRGPFERLPVLSSHPVCTRSWLLVRTESRRDRRCIEKLWTPRSLSRLSLLFYELYPIFLRPQTVLKEPYKGNVVLALTPPDKNRRRKDRQLNFMRLWKRTGRNKGKNVRTFCFRSLTKINFNHPNLTKTNLKCFDVARAVKNCINIFCWSIAPLFCCDVTFVIKCVI